MENLNAARTEVRRFRYKNEWEGHIHITGRNEQGILAAHAELFRDAQFKCRIMVAQQFRDDKLATAALEEKAMQWMDDWNSRDHSGETGFTEL